MTKTPEELLSILTPGFSDLFEPMLKQLLTLERIDELKKLLANKSHDDARSYSVKKIEERIAQLERLK